MRCSSPHWRCDLMMKLPPQVNTAFEMLEAAGYQAYLVGGAVRDYVRDNSPAKDWDITTNALPEQVEEIFTGYHLIETGLKHGTVTVVIDQEPLEITTYRVDGDYSDHRHPDSVSFTRSLKDDLERRDFTMNALAYNPRTGVVDFVGGKADIAGDLVRCVGDPDRRFQEDGLRMLRALRFASVYGMTIEAATAAAIHRNKHLLKGIAAERILVELTKMLCAQGAAGVLRDFADVLAVPIPELTPMFGFPQHNPHHDKDVWDHTIAVIESITPEPVLRWAALLHDIGKPSCFSLAEDGIGHFFGHSDQSTSMAESILSRLRFDNASKEQIVRLVRYHDMPITADRKPIKRLLSKHGEDATRQLIELHKADTLGQSAICRHRIAIFEEVSQMINEILQEESCFTLKDLAVNGHDMMTLGFQGPTIGRVLQECLDAVLDEQIPNEHEAVLRGGQYDPLAEQFRPGARAIGYGLYLSELDRLSQPESGKTVMLNVALPKGRLGDKVYDLLAGVGYGCPESYSDTRKLVVENPAAGIRYFLVKPSDVAIYVEHGAADIGIVGKDILAESGADVYELLDTGLGKCRMCVAGPKDFTEDQSRTLRVATKFVNIAKRYYAAQGRDIDIIKLNGSIELAPILGLSDVIVDIVETGTTLRENDLKVLTEFMPISARFIANRASYQFKRPQIDKLLRRLTEVTES